ncbi:MAG TPA: hypothetical protein EYG03_23530 [Planctomycetes bacterium]|nr:hypothetical protein [Fuerstiella sp.]HIK94929.1 hypothetical protein [Planctomycetota bacterium]
MPESANVKSIDAVKRFHAAVVQFQEEARLCVSALEMQLLRILGWLERDRPGYWKREIEACYREMGEARVRLHQCRMRKYADYKPTCFEEKKDLEKAKRDLEFAQKQIPVVKYWNVNAQQEANEYHGRASQLTQMLERDVPRLLALLHHAVDRLEAYGDVQLPGTRAENISFRPAGSPVDEATSSDKAETVAPHTEETDTSEKTT